MGDALSLCFSLLPARSVKAAGYTHGRLEGGGSHSRLGVKDAQNLNALISICLIISPNGWAIADKATEHLIPCDSLSSCWFWKGTLRTRGIVSRVFHLCTSCWGMVFLESTIRVLWDGLQPSDRGLESDFSPCRQILSGKIWTGETGVGNTVKPHQLFSPLEKPTGDLNSLCSHPVWPQLLFYNCISEEFMDFGGRWQKGIFYLSADPAAILLPSGDQEHRSRFWETRKIRCNSKQILTPPPLLIWNKVTKAADINNLAAMVFRWKLSLQLYMAFYCQKYPVSCYLTWNRLWMSRRLIYRQLELHLGGKKNILLRRL